MDWAQAKGAALDLLREPYAREIERIAEELRPRIEARELGGFLGDGKEANPDPYRALQDELRRRFGGFEEALLMLAVTPSDWTYGESNGPAGEAVEAAALDVLRLALARGWYKPRRGEYPSAKQLRGEVVWNGRRWVPAKRGGGHGA